jgi:hypothetical protein
VKLDESVGLKKSSKVDVKTYHPTEKIVGSFAYGSTVDIEVAPFRSCLIKLSDASSEKEFGIEGIDYQVVMDLKGKPMEIQLLGMPGSDKTIKLSGDYSAFKSATIDGVENSGLLKGEHLSIRFEGQKLNKPYHRKICELSVCPIPIDAEAIYESTCFAANNNALEVRELKRSGESIIPQVQSARKAFFEQRMFEKRELWDKYLFDGDPSTAFSVNMRWGGFEPEKAALRLDLGHSQNLDSLVVQTIDEFSLQPLKSEEGQYALISNDLNSWKSVLFYAGKSMKIDLSASGQIRYVKLQPAPLRITEVIGYKNGKQVDRTGWRASNLFRPYITNSWNNNLIFRTQKSWSAKFTFDQIPEGSYLCIAIEGEHGFEGAFAGAKIDGQYVGCADRAPSFKSNTWEVGVRATDKNYTYYIALDKTMISKEIEAFVLGFNKAQLDLKPQVYITAYPAPFQKKLLILK